MRLGADVSIFSKKLSLIFISDNTDEKMDGKTLDDVVNSVNQYRKSILALYTTKIVNALQDAKAMEGLVPIESAHMISLVGSDFWFLDGLSKELDALNLETDTYRLCISLVTQGGQKYVQWEIDS
jgi:hypothetical protein